MFTYRPYDYIYGKYCFDGEQQRTRTDLRRLYKRWPRVTPESLMKQFGLSSSEMNTLTTNPITITNNGGGGVDHHLTSTSPLQSGAGDRDSAMIELEQIYGHNVNMNNEATSPSSDRNSNRKQSTSSRASITNYSPSVDDDSVISEAAIFRGVDRLKLINQIISYHGVGGCYLDPAQLMKDDCILAYSPLHDMVELRELEAKWLTFLDFPWNQPTDQIKDYFGEKIGLYFCC
jgi:hypothetical protein